jgi:CDP-diacylglycerol--glycerol-3-phosphate 3-phosphatidyltransferase
LADEKSLPGLQASRKVLARHFTLPVVKLLAKTPVTPNALTVCSLVITVGAALLVGTEHFVAAGLVLLFAALFDIFDGALARATNRVTTFGAALDSTLDRLAEAAIMIGLLVVYARAQALPEIVLAGVALVSSFMVSYVRARAEGLGVECQVGIFTRSERIALLVLGLLFAQFDYVLVAALSIITFFSVITVGQRLYEVWKRTK